MDKANPSLEHEPGNDARFPNKKVANDDDAKSCHLTICKTNWASAAANLRILQQSRLKRRRDDVNL